MVAGVPWWQWVLSTLLVPLAIGLGAAYVGHFLSLRKARYEQRIVDHRTTYDGLLSALAELTSYDERAVQLAYYEFPSQGAYDEERQSDEAWEGRRTAALALIERVRLRGQLGASRPVLEAVEALLVARVANRQAYARDELNSFEAMDADMVASRAALEAVRRAVDREV